MSDDEIERWGPTGLKHFATIPDEFGDITGIEGAGMTLLVHTQSGHTMAYSCDGKYTVVHALTSARMQ